MKQNYTLKMRPINEQPSYSNNNQICTILSSDCIKILLSIFSLKEANSVFQSFKRESARMHCENNYVPAARN